MECFLTQNPHICEDLFLLAQSWENSRSGRIVGIGVIFRYTK